jgi:hypothetical protein
MPLGFLNLVRKYGLNAPLIYLAILGLLLIFIGAILDSSTLISLGELFTILGFCLSILWIFIRRIRAKEKK